MTAAKPSARHCHSSWAIATIRLVLLGAIALCSAPVAARGTDSANPGQEVSRDKAGRMTKPASISGPQIQSVAPLEDTQIAAEAKSLSNGLYITGWTATYGANYSSLTLNIPAINNDSYSRTSGTLRLSYWATTTDISRGQGFTGYRLATFPTLAPLPPRNSYSNVSQTASMLLPPYGTYWLVTVLEEYDSVNCPAADRYCLEDSWKSSEQRTFGIEATVTLAIQKSGSGSVTSSPAGINCGSTCSASFTQGTAVSLFAAPSAGYSFTGWSGGGCSGTGSCAVVMNAATTVTASFVPATPQFVNISTRGTVLTGDNVMIAGFIIRGAAAQTVLVTVRGPSLAAYGIASPLANPKLELYSGQTKIYENDNWQVQAAVPGGQTPSPASSITALGGGLAPTNANESALLVTLPPGAYTAIVSGVGGGTGVAIVEVFAR